MAKFFPKIFYMHDLLKLYYREIENDRQGKFSLPVANFIGGGH